MKTVLEILVTLLILSNLLLMGSSRLGTLIRTVAAQALILGLMSILNHWHCLEWGLMLTAFVSILIKAMILPRLLTRAVREAHVRREVEPIVGFTASLLIGLLLLAVSVYLGSQLKQPQSGYASLLTPTSLFSMMVGLFILVSRRKALTQVLGYLAMENGIYAFGLAFTVRETFLVEIGILLDVFVAVFVMGIMIYHINRNFDHIDTDKLAMLKE